MLLAKPPAKPPELNWSLEVYFGDKEYFGGQRFWPAESWGDPRTYNWLLTYNMAANRCSAYEAHYHHRGCSSGYSVSGRLSLGPLSHTATRHIWHRDIAYQLRRQVEEWKERS